MKMAKICPFRGWRYNQGQVRLADVLTQPYDKITPAMQERYYATSPFNLIPVEKGKSFQDDTAHNNVYTRAAEKLAEWSSAGVLAQDFAPSVYIYAQEFVIPAESQTGDRGGHPEVIRRRGFIALGRLEDYSAEIVFPHEKTLSGPKADRLELLRQTRTQTGQLFMLYEDDGGEIEVFMDEAMRQPSLSELRDEFEVQHRLWRVSDAHAVQQFVAAMGPKKIVIADGHHRYETALAYRDECRLHDIAPVRNETYEKAMMTFVNYTAPGLVILPTHRVIRNVRDFDPAAFRQKLLRWYEELPVPRDPQVAQASAHNNFHLALRDHVAEHAIGVCTSEGCVLYRLRDDVALENLLPDLSPAQRNLDVVLLHRLILQECMGISAEAVTRESHITYQREMSAAVAAVGRGKAQIAFLLNPVSVTQVAGMAIAGEALPQKSTDFYPKLLSGLVIYRLDG
jgi:uncharacterized protein (DUF1015 family)